MPNPSLFAPPTPEELKMSAPPGPENLFAPPTDEELGAPIKEEKKDNDDDSDESNFIRGMVAFGKSLGKNVQKASNAVDSVGGAPARKALDEALSGEFMQAADTFTDKTVDPNTAPDGLQIVGKHFPGIPEKIPVNYGPPGAIMPEEAEELGMNFPLKSAAGVGIDLAADRLLLAGPLLKAGSKLPAAAGKALKSFAEMKAFQGTGAMVKDFDRIHGVARAREIGRTMLDKNLISVGDTFQDVATKTKLAREEAGNAIGAIVKESDDAVKTVDLSSLKPWQRKALEKTTLDTEKLAARLKAKLANEYKGIPGENQALEAVFKELDVIAKNGTNTTLEQLHRARVGFDDLINWSKQNKELKLKEKVFRNARDEIAEAINQRVNAIDKLSGAKRGTTLKKVNKEYSNLIEAEKIAAKRAGNEAGRSPIGLRDTLAGGFGGSVGATIAGPAGAMVGSVLGAMTSKALRQFGSSVVAKNADRVARLLEKSPKSFGVYGEKLINAANASPRAFVETVELLKSDNEFNQVLKSVAEKKEENAGRKVSQVKKGDGFKELYRKE